MGTAEYIARLRADAARYEQEAQAQTFEFNKGYFEGKAEQNLKLADALDTNNIDCLDDI